MSFFGNRTVYIGNNVDSKLIVNRESKQVILTIYNNKGEVIDDIVRWSFDMLEEKLLRKLKYLAFVKADKKIVNKEVYFKYHKVKFYKLKTFDNFINLIENGKIRISFKISVFKSGRRYGQIHNHGTSFDLSQESITELFDVISHV